MHGRNNGENNLEGKVDIRTTDLGHKLNAYLASDAGYSYVMKLQERQYNEELKPSMEKAMNSPAVQNLSEDDARIVIAAIAKVKNQAGSVSKSIWTGFDNPHATKEQLINNIKQHSNSWVDDGVSATVKGAHLFNTLSKDSGKLGQMFDRQFANNPMRVTNFNSNPEEQTLDALFRSPAKAERMIEAINNNQPYSLAAGHKIEKEAYSVSVDAAGALRTQDVNGRGYKFENSQWQETSKVQGNSNPVQPDGAHSAPYWRSENRPTQATTLAQLSPASQSLHADVSAKVQELYVQNNHPIDQGTHNTAMNVTVALAEQGATGVDRIAVKDGQMHALQMRGAEAIIASVNTNVAANTLIEQSLSQLAAVDSKQSLAQANLTQSLNQSQSQGRSLG